MSKLLMCALAATVVTIMCGALAVSANAESLSFSPGGSIALPSTGTLTFGSGTTAIECDVTLGGSLSASSVELVVGRQLGSVSEVGWTNCSGGEIDSVLGLPWPIVVSRVVGTLPNELAGVLVNLTGASLELSSFGGIVSCLYSGDAAALLAMESTSTEGIYTTGSVSLLSDVQLPLISGSFLCPEFGGLAGTLGVAPEQTVAVGGGKAQVTGSPINFTAVNQTKTVRVKNISVLNIKLQIERVYSSDETKFKVTVPGGEAGCSAAKILEQDRECEAIVRFLGPIGAKAKFNVDMQNYEEVPFAQGELTS